eukprot:GHVS01034859.1.p1 GENE.GHVS01034859.1~~GHVS01034859.1.p1  ORF type:complete len:269 (+),score=62.26 GHVS01034859.1:89-808(+)
MTTKHLQLPRTHVKMCLKMLNSSLMFEEEEEKEEAQVEEKIIRDDCLRVSRKSLLVVRNEIKDPSRQTFKVLQTLGLKRFYDSVFVPFDGVHCEMLNIIHPYVFYGFPTKQTIENLFLRKAVFKSTPQTPSSSSAPPPSISSLPHSDTTPPQSDTTASRSVCALTDNFLVEQRLGHLHLLCVHDLVQQVWECGQHFRAIQEELGSFRLCARRRVDGVFYRHKCFGNFDAAINLLVSKLI